MTVRGDSLQFIEQNAHHDLCEVNDCAKTYPS